MAVAGLKAAGRQAMHCPTIHGRAASTTCRSHCCLSSPVILRPSRRLPRATQPAIAVRCQPSDHLDVSACSSQSSQSRLQKQPESCISETKAHPQQSRQEQGVCIACLSLCAFAALSSSADAAVLSQLPQYDLAAEVSPGTAKLLALIARPALSIGILFMLIRIVLTWYPNIKGNKLPWSIVVAPTEPFVGPTRKALPPVGGVDIAPIVWLAIFTFVNEILLGPQGILNLLQRKLEL